MHYAYMLCGIVSQRIEINLEAIRVFNPSNLEKKNLGFLRHRAGLKPSRVVTYLGTVSLMPWTLHATLWLAASLGIQLGIGLGWLPYGPKA